MSFTVTANTGYNIATVTGCGGSLSGSTYTTGAIAGACTVTASFSAAITYTVTATAGSNGAISPVGASTVISGQSQSFTVTANNGYDIATVTGCGGSLSGSTYTTGAITGACTVTAGFTTSAAITDSITGMVLLKAPSGTYTMGDTFGDGSSDELPTHQVTVGEFYIGKYQVTQGQWQAVMGSNPSSFSSCGADCPVESVNFSDIQAFITTLNQLSGKKQPPADGGGMGIRRAERRPEPGVQRRQRYQCRCLVCGQLRRNYSSGGPETGQRPGSV